VADGLHGVEGVASGTPACSTDLDAGKIVMIVTGRTSAIDPAPDATGTTGGPDDEAEEETIDERLLRELAERVRSERLRNNLQRSAGQRFRAGGTQAPCFTDDLDDQILSPRPMLARDHGL
jgi:hypothetical protein